jgi:hypothetical protein
MKEQFRKREMAHIEIREDGSAQPALLCVSSAVHGRVLPVKVTIHSLLWLV